MAVSCGRRSPRQHLSVRIIALSGSALIGLLLCALVVTVAGRASNPIAHAEPLPGGTPKLSLSTKTVTPTIAAPGAVTLAYNILLRNAGAWTATGTSLVDALPISTTYVAGSAQASSGMTPTVVSGVLMWVGDVGFDSSVAITFAAAVDPAFTFGRIANSAVISQPQIAASIQATAVTTVTDVPILMLDKSSAPAIPGPEKPLVYTLTVTNMGQPATDFPITLTDRVPLSTTLLSVGSGGFASPAGDVVTWTQNVSLPLGASTAFTFSVLIDDVPAGAVITNEDYRVEGPPGTITVGTPYTVTVVDPQFLLYKQVWPDPPGSNREMTYTLTVVNAGSLATGLVITDRVPAGVTYMRGGVLSSGVVSWSLPSLDTSQTAGFTYTVYISDVLNVTIVNADYAVCSLEGICEAGEVLTSVVRGPNFAANVVLDPIAKKPGGGGGPVTPTLVVRNLGPGYAIDARATLYFQRISVSGNDLYAYPPIGTPPPFPSGPACLDNCVSYLWTGSLGSGEAVTFTTIEGQSTIGGDEGTHYTATVVISDSLANGVTVPLTGTASGRVTHFSELIPTKSAPPVIGRGQLMTYTIGVWNSGLATDLPPWLTDTVPLSTTLVWISDDGVSQTVGADTVISWTLPSLGPGAMTGRAFSVRVDNDLISGTQIVNDRYGTRWFEITVGQYYSATGQPVTTTVREVGLIDSFKEVTPTLARPGPGIVLTYTLHLANSSPISLTGVTADDVLPWEVSTYQRDAVADTGAVISDIVTLHWTGDLAPLSSGLVTFTVVVDPYYEGPVTNTAVISHPLLLDPVMVQAIAYVTNQPALFISKSATPDPVVRGGELEYTVRVVNAGQQATALVVTDTLPHATQYVSGSASAGGQLVGNELRWLLPVLQPGESAVVTFRVTVNADWEVVNEHYGVTCAEGVEALGLPVVTPVDGRGTIYLPVAFRNAGTGRAAIPGP